MGEDNTDIPNHNIDDDCICPWCHEILKQPKTLECGHNMCESCIKELLCFSILQSFDVCTSKISIPTKIPANLDSLDKHFTVEQITCPMCKKSTNIPDYSTLIDSLSRDEKLVERSNQLHKKINNKICGWCEKEKGLEECSKCEVIYCNSCKQETHNRPAFESHQFYDVEEMNQQRMKTCSKHKGRKKDLFCKKCSVSLCLYCTKFESDHKDHELCSFPEAIKEIDREIDQLMGRFQYISNDMETFHETIRRSSQKLEDVS